MSRSIHVISPAIGTGNRIDLEIVCPLLRENGFRVTEYPVMNRRRPILYGKVLKHALSLRGRFDINLFMGPLFPEWLPWAKKNIWIPNPEGFHEHHRRHLPRIDHVLAKTRLTERLFRELSRPTTYVGFTSRDQFDPSVPRDPTRFFHARSSSYKGTVRLLEAWKAHPEWPGLVAVISDEQVLPGFQADNVRIIRRHVSDAEMKRLQNEFTFHICPSEAEGFGHYIMEPMGCGAVVFATNGAPMNELVQPSRGVLLDCLPDSPPVGLTHRSYFDPESLDREIRRACAFDEASRRQMGDAARTFYLQNDRDFRRRFIETMQAL
jgi:glycosyltransferase involved in cell wall biosynthesis